MTENEPVGRTPTRRRPFPTVTKLRRLAVLLWPHARSHKGLLLAGSFLSLVLILLRLAQPWPLKWIIDTLTHDHSLPKWLSLPREHTVALLSFTYVAVSLLAGLANYWQTILLSGLGNRIIYSFRNRVFDHLLRLSLSYHEKRTVGELVTRVVYDTSRLRRGVNGILVRTFQVVFTFLFTVVMIVLLNWEIALIILLIGTFALLLMSRNGKRVLSESRKNRKREGQLAAVVAEDMHAIREFQAYRPEHLTDKRFEKRNTRSLASEQAVRRLAAKMLTQVEVLLAAGICVVLWIGALAVQSNDLSVGSLVLISHYAIGLFAPFRQFAQQAAQTGRTMAAAERLENIIAKDAVILEARDADALLDPPQIIRCSNVSLKSSRKRHVSRKWMLNDISFEARGGERIAVLGDNGAGKSTLLRLLTRLADPQLGSIELDGKDIRTFTLASLRSQISIVFQDSIFFGLTLRENIAFGKPDATTEEIEQCVVRCRLDQWVGRLKKGLDTPIRRQGAMFSGGEKQKIAIARALLRNGNIWLLDEPTNDLDETSKEAMVKLLVEATENRTTFWVTHDHSVLQYCSRALLLEEGRVAFWGTTHDFTGWLETHAEAMRTEHPLLAETIQEEGE